MLDELMTPGVLGAALCEYTEVSVHGLCHKQEKAYGQKDVDLTQTV